jgi:UDP-2,3-diacylglucosamine hydrolase
MATQSATLFISDLHLDESRPEIEEQFISFLQTEARQATALYILGDLFEVWVGDDDPAIDKQRIQVALRDLTDSGVPCYVMHGNRDFLIGTRFLKSTGCKLLNDPCVIDLYGRRVLLLHGDLLCTDDHDYQRLRRIVRNPIVRLIFRLLTLKQRQKLAEKIRKGSQAHINNTMNSAAAKIMDVNAGAVINTFNQYGVDLMIHGHTHRPAIHQVMVEEKMATRIVLGDWYEQGSVLRINDHGWELAKLGRSETES